jgi:hypothetical protein
MTFDLLAALDGTWHGRGNGGYPTIETFEYTEQTRFEFDDRYPLIHFEQRTVLDDGEPGHWESGFLRVAEDGAIEVSTAQDGGRVEVLRGPLTVTPEGFRLDLESVALGHDARLLRTGRLVEVRGDRLRYEMKMSTTTTDEPRWLTHLTAELVRRPLEVR